MINQQKQAVLSDAQITAEAHEIGRDMSAKMSLGLISSGDQVHKSPADKYCDAAKEKVRQDFAKCGWPLILSTRNGYFRIFLA